MCSSDFPIRMKYFTQNNCDAPGKNKTLVCPKGDTNLFFDTKANIVINNHTQLFA